MNKHNPDLRNIYADGDYLCTLPFDVVISADLYLGCEIQPDFKEKFAVLKDIKRAKDRAMIILSYRVHSKKELCDKLIAKEFDPDTAEIAVSELEESGFISDYDFALTYAESLIKRNYGISQIKFKLQQKGIESAVIADICDELCEKNDFTEIIYNLICSKYSGFDFSQKKNRDKVMRFFASKGYEIPDIIEAVNMFENEEGDYESQNDL